MKDTIARLRKQHKNLFMFHKDNQALLIRPLTREEVDYYNNKCEDERSLYEEITFLCIVYPSYISLEDIPSGWPDVLGPEILSISGFVDPKFSISVYMNAKKKIESDFLTQAETIIRAAFSDISFEEMQSWNVYKLMDHLARAEWSLQQIYQLDVQLDVELPENEELTEEQRDAQLKEKVQELRESGQDPMRVLPIPQDREFMQLPLITGRKWNEEEIIDAFRSQSTTE